MNAPIDFAPFHHNLFKRASAEAKLAGVPNISELELKEMNASDDVFARNLTYIILDDFSNTFHI